MKKIIFTVFAILSAVALAGCGGGGGGGAASPTPGGEGDGEATVQTLSALPSLDLSTYDESTSSSSNLTAPISKGISAKGLSLKYGEDMHAVGKSSRAGCETNIHKQEIFRMSQQIQVGRCYPKVMEKIGLIEIPNGGYNFYAITPPEGSEEDLDKMCEGIPEEATQEREKCLAGEGGNKGGEEMKMRIGIINNELHIDMCEGGVLREEMTWAAAGSVYTGVAVHADDFLGHMEMGRAAIAVDIGDTGKVEDEMVTFSSDGTVSATTNMMGAFGNGRISFESVKADASSKISGAFAGNFTDPYTQRTTTFTGKTYSLLGGTETKTGCAKYSFSGSPPPMRVQDMIPFGISENDLNNFLRTFGANMGIYITADNYQTILLCPNPAFDPENPSPTIPPMVVMEGDSCQQVTNTGIECFSVNNSLQQTGDFGGTSTLQTFLIIANSDSPYFGAVNAFDLTPLDPTVDTPQFSRAWDCTGSFTTINFGAMTAAQMAAAESAMQECWALEEKAFANRGMGEYNCGGEEQKNGVNDMAEGGGGEEQFGLWGGEWGFAESQLNTCPHPGMDGAPAEIGRLFVNYISGLQYCFSGNARCQPFTVDGNGPIASGIPDDVIAIGTYELTGVDFREENPRVKVTYLKPAGGGECVQYYNLEQFAFNGPGEYGGSGGGTEPGQGGFIPPACMGADGVPVTEKECMAICSNPQADCRGD